MSIFDEIDINRDGSISREEFRIAIEKMRNMDLQKMKRALQVNDSKCCESERNSSLPEYKYVAELCPPPALPPKEAGSPKYTLVLDMDETLLHCDVDLEASTFTPHHTFDVRHQGKEYIIHAWLRPGLMDFLDKIAGKFEVVIFTASQPAYANVILDILDPEKKIFQHRLFRESCIEVEDNHVKDLNVLGRDLSKVIMVDNSPHVFGYQVDNGVPISNWYDDPTDNELEKLLWFLQGLEGDARNQIREKFRLHQLIEEAVVN
ncbi:MAG: hypothetical protein SGARI_004170 [Bacillariaceae sp.]